MVVKFAAKWWLAGEKCFSNVMALLPPSQNVRHNIFLRGLCANFDQWYIPNYLAPQCVNVICCICIVNLFRFVYILYIFFTPFDRTLVSVT
jgi:hypothetical protein